jgi:exopolysaccharide biosynthesis operon protein EpsL
VKSKVLTRLKNKDHLVKRKVKIYLQDAIWIVILSGYIIGNNSYAVSSPDDTINPYVVTSILYDSNFLRLGKNVNPLLVTGKNTTSEIIKQVTAGVNADWQFFSRQHFLINANVNQNWFQNLTGLDYTGWNTEAKWNWVAGNYFSGNLGYKNLQTLGSFAQLNGLVSNMLNTQNFYGSGGYLFHPSGKVSIAIARIDTVYSSVSRQASNSILDDYQINLQYIKPTGDTLGLRFILENGQYPQRVYTATSSIDNSFTSYNYALTSSYQALEKIKVDGYAGIIQQNYLHLSVRDFTTWIAQIALNWEITEKTNMNLIVARNVMQSTNLYATFQSTQGVTLKPTWRATPKVAFSLPLSYQQIQYLGNTGFDPAVLKNQDYNDYTSSKVGMTMSYQPVDNISIGGQLNYEKRDSQNLNRSYVDESAGLNIQAKF